jgi:hypothetical protein
MPTRPYRILSRNLYQRLGARAAWDRAIEIIRKSDGDLLAHTITVSIWYVFCNRPWRDDDGTT